MKNEVFRFLSKEDKEHILLCVLRVRTEGLLYVKEECALLHALTQKNQFRIHAYRDINAFRRAFDIRNKTKYEVVYGEAALADSLKPNTLIGTGIAVMASLDKTPDLINQLYIYIPQIRKCKGVWLFNTGVFHVPILAAVLDLSGFADSCNYLP